jgi:hypothetical protein
MKYKLNKRKFINEMKRSGTSLFFLKFLRTFTLCFSEGRFYKKYMYSNISYMFRLRERAFEQFQKAKKTFEKTILQKIHKIEILTKKKVI